MFEIEEIKDVIAERRFYLEGQPEANIRVCFG